ncbi:dihydropteridine reductase [Entomortierella parvispora]|uniref:Dihydropteridine reductase n=1 Tax=Entomortierella parvispora TaxID=205924 RepID=A0A9P3HC14_9FUNG|nr:dihydropteridine reductase [Entomortierella parvispora]
MISSIVVYGGSGALGRAIVSAFIAKKWSVISVDFFPNQEATSNILLVKNDSLEEQGKRVVNEVKEPVDAIVCVAGGWAGGNAASPELFANSELMWKQSVHSSLVAAHLASKSLKAGGLLTLTGAYPAQKGTPFMIGYGMAKAAVHQLVASLAGPDSGLPADAKVNAILPVTLDTPMNRSGMPSADFSSWTPCSEVAETLYAWASKSKSVNSGKLVEIVTKDNKTTYTEK